MRLLSVIIRPRFQVRCQFIHPSLVRWKLRFLTIPSPGIGLGAILSRTTLLTPPLLVAATKALASQAPALKDPNAGLLPDVTDVRRISVEIAAAVIKKAVEKGLATEKDIPTHDEMELREWIGVQMWDAEYRPLQKVEARTASKEARGEAGSKGRRGVD